MHPRTEQNRTTASNCQTVLLIKNNHHAGRTKTDEIAYKQVNQQNHLE